MILSFVVAMVRNRVIGRDNRLPWHLPEDLKFFKRITLGEPVLMRRKTFEAIGRPLPGRTNIVLTTDQSYRAEGCRVVHSVAAALAVAEPAEEAMIIGGAALYAQTLELAQRIYLTRVEAEVPGDTWFPELKEQDWRAVWREEHPADARHGYPYTFMLLERQSAP